jgi:hypothetical protein
MAKPKRKLGPFLTVWLCIMLVANLASAVMYFIFAPALEAAMPQIGYFIIYLMGALSIVNIGITILLFKWKRIAFFAFCGMSVVAMVVNIGIGLGFDSLLGLLGPALLWILIRPKWKQFE